MTAHRCCRLGLIIYTTMLAALPSALFLASARAQDADRDGDGVLDVDELNVDTDRDGVFNVLDPDDDGDTVLTHYEYFLELPIIDFDLDGIPDYLDPDDDGDHLLTSLEAPDANGDGNPRDAQMTTNGSCDYLNEDDDNDTVLTLLERPGDHDRDTDMDGSPDHRDRDDDADGRPTVEEIGGNPTRDTNGDGLVDYLDPDDDGDTILTLTECALLAWIDVDRDGLINSVDTDSDGDGLLDSVEGDMDRDMDGVPDYLEPAGKQGDQTGMGSTLPDFGFDGGPDDTDGGLVTGVDGAVGTPERDIDGGAGLALHTNHASQGCSLAGRSARESGWSTLACALALFWFGRRQRAGGVL